MTIQDEPSLIELLSRSLYYCDVVCPNGIAVGSRTHPQPGHIGSLRGTRRAKSKVKLQRLTSNCENYSLR